MSARQVDMLNQQIRLNPNVIAWPGERLSYFLAEGGARERLMLSDLPQSLSLLMKRFLTPTAPSTVFGRLGAQDRRALESLVAQRLLLTGTARRTHGARSWSGFALDDHRSFSRRNLTSITAERSHLIASKEVLVFDNVIDAKTIAAVARWFFLSPFRRIDVDQLESASSQHWLLRMQPAQTVVDVVPVFSKLHQFATSAFPQYALSLREIKAYSTPYGDTPGRHRDREQGAAVTLVLFANDHWQDDWGGELLIYDETDPILAIQPRPGRVALFRGDLWHRAGAPMRVCQVSRYSLVLRYDILPGDVGGRR